MTPEEAGRMFGAYFVVECPHCEVLIRVPPGPCWMTCACGATFESRPGEPRDTPEASVWRAKRPDEIVPLTDAERANTDRLLALVFGE